MDVSFSLRQQTSVLEGPLYRVKNEITQAVGASPAVFVFKTENQAFSHYATAADMEQWPDSVEAAQQDNKEFFRKTSVTRDWGTLAARSEDLSMTARRLQGLASDLKQLNTDLVLDQTVLIQGA